MTAFEPVSKHLVLEIEVTLLSEPATRVFETTLDPVRSALFMLEDALPRRAYDDREPIDAMLLVINTRFTKVETELKNELARLETLAKNVGAEPPKRYLHTAPVVVCSYSPNFMWYIDLLVRLDNVMRWLDGLWMARVVPNKDRTDIIVHCRNLLLKLNRELQTIKERALFHVAKVESQRGKRMADKAHEKASRAAAMQIRKAQRKSKAASDVVIHTPSTPAIASTEQPLASSATAAVSHESQPAKASAKNNNRTAPAASPPPVDSHVGAEPVDHASSSSEVAADTLAAA